AIPPSFSCDRPMAEACLLDRTAGRKNAHRLVMRQGTPAPHARRWSTYSSTIARYGVEEQDLRQYLIRTFAVTGACEYRGKPGGGRGWVVRGGRARPPPTDGRDAGGAGRKDRHQRAEYRQDRGRTDRHPPVGDGAPARRRLRAHRCRP